MKIAIDCSKAVNESAGIAKYTRELTKNLISAYPDDQFFLFCNFVRQSEDKLAKMKAIIGKNKNVRYKVYHFPGQLKDWLLNSNFSLLNGVLKENDIYHAPDYLSFDNGLKIPQILTVHDLTMMIFPERLGQKWSQKNGETLKKACTNATMIISDSRATKDDIKKYFSIADEKIRVVYLGADESFKKITDSAQTRRVLVEKYKIKFPYLLFVSTIEPRKNIANLLKAFAKFAQDPKNKFYHLVLAGKKGWNYEGVEETYKKLSCKDKIHFLDFVPDEDLPYFYNNCSLFCYPSIYEGFGLPLLEAMSCGAPVLTSKVSSLPEIGGEAAYYIDPKDYNSIYNGIDKIIGNSDLAKKMKQKSLEQAKKFSWEKCAKETMGVYKEVYGKN